MNTTSIASKYMMVVDVRFEREMNSYAQNEKFALTTILDM